MKIFHFLFAATLFIALTFVNTSRAQCTIDFEVDNQTNCTFDGDLMYDDGTGAVRGVGITIPPGQNIVHTFPTAPCSLAVGLLVYDGLRPTYNTDAEVGPGTSAGCVSPCVDYVGDCDTPGNTWVVEWMNHSFAIIRPH